MLRSENISYTISREALPQSTTETKIVSRSAKSMFMHNMKTMSCNNKYQNTGSGKGIEILVLEHNC